MGYLAECKDSSQLGMELYQLKARTGWSARRAADWLDEHGPNMLPGYDNLLNTVEYCDLATDSSHSSANGLNGSHH